MREKSFSWTMFSFLWWLFLFTLSLMLSCPVQAESTGKVVVESFENDVDRSVMPGDDFFRFANGKWLRAHPVPPDKSDYGAFDEVKDRNDLKLRAIVEAALKSDAPAGSPTRKLGDFYGAGMDRAAIERQGLSPLKELFARIDAMGTGDDMGAMVALLQGVGIDPFFSLHAEPDPRNSSVMMARLFQGGLSLPDRDYYFKTDKESVSIRKDFCDHVRKMYLLLGENAAAAEKNASTVMDLETCLAGASFTTVENRDPFRINNPMTTAELQKLTPHFAWTVYFKSLDYPGIREVNVGQKKFLLQVDHLCSTIPMEQWKVFLRWKLISATAPFLPEAFEREDFRFFESRLEGKKEQEPRWKRVMGTINYKMGELMGRLYVKEYFPPEAKTRMLAMTGNLRKAFGEIIGGLSWMSAPTKEKALEKLECMEIMVGYPDRWQDYEGLEITGDSYVQNVLRANNFNFRKGSMGLDLVGRPADRSRWDMPPQVVNAMYDPFKNLMIFPAGILQSPFFDMSADDATNYGAIGVVIGHEMTHGFDDEGRLYDKRGNLKEWWTDRDAQEFERRTVALVAQFNGYEVLPGSFINGRQTLGENIADLGGLTISLRAYRLSRGSGEAASREPAAFNDIQRFFLSYCRVWHTTIRDEALRNQVMTDPHSPARYRVNGAVFNVPEFYEAFPEVKPGDRLYRAPKERPVIWGLER